MRVVDIGGGTSGLQFVLDISGIEVVTVDPFVKYGSSSEWPDPVGAHSTLNRLFGTNVTLKRSRLSRAGLSDNSFDIAYCISTLEHLQQAEADEIVTETKRILRPGGHFVLTIDLFLNLTPFTTRLENEWGRNIDIASLARRSGMTMICGDPHELCGFAEFSPTAILAGLESYEINESYPQLAQLFVLRKSSDAQTPGKRQLADFSD